MPEAEVRLDEVLLEVGDTLLYEYDYGDGWEHRLKLEAVTDRADDDAPAVCVDGRRAGPPEDCGGIGGYEAMLAAAALRSGSGEPGVDDVTQVDLPTRAVFGSHADAAAYLATFDESLAARLPRWEGSREYVGATTVFQAR